MRRCVPLATATQSCQNANLSRNYAHPDGMVTDLLRECEGIATTYYSFLRLLGDSAFGDRQRQYSVLLLTHKSQTVRKVRGSNSDGASTS